MLVAISFHLIELEAMLIIQNIFTFLGVFFLHSDSFFFNQHKQVHDASVTADGENS